jgi:hypothetical protein
LKTSKKERKNKNLKRKKEIMKKILMLLAVFIMNALGFMNSVHATSYIDSAYIYSVGDCGQLLKYKGVIVKTDYVQYSYNGVNYPAYCMDKTKVRSTGRTIYCFCTRSNYRCWIMESNN